jgi:diguanylate cyclase (GGDEF)-like protein
MMNGTTMLPIAPETGIALAGTEFSRPEGDPLRDALLDSRQRWRTLVAMAADFAFETDAQGRFVFVSPETVLGWPAAALLGQPATLLLAAAGAAFDPFHPTITARSRRAWLKRADGGLACLSFACAPLLDGSVIVGSRGVAQDVSAEDLREAETAATLRRGEVIEHILWQMRQEILAPRMMQVALAELIAALGADGAAVITLIPATDPLAVLHHVGKGLASVLPTLRPMLEIEASDPATAIGEAGHKVLTCPSDTRFGERAGLTLWRESDDRDWDEEDRLLVSAAASLIRVVLEHEAIQRELARQARTDPLTGLLNRRSFLEEMHRRVDRLDHEGQTGTLLFMDLDHFKRLNDSCGHEVGDEALILAADILRATVRPTDLVARLGGDEFATWMDGSDEMTAAERAERLRLEAPAAFARSLPPTATPLSMSIGIATRQPGSGEDIDSIMRRADMAMYEVKRRGRGRWQVSQDEASP